MKYIKIKIKIIKLFLVIAIEKKIVIGSSGTSYKGWVSTDIDVLDIASKSDWKRLLKGIKLKAILMEHVLEHIAQDRVILSLRNIICQLKKNAYVRIAVPDGLHPDEQYIGCVKPGGIGSGAKDHKVLYNYRSLAKIMEAAGFKCDILEYWDENGIFHFNDWHPDTGMITRSIRYDDRNIEGKPVYTSLIIDGYKK